MSAHQGFLTRISAETSLPFPPMELRVLLGIEEGIRVAWKSLISDATKHAIMLKCDEVDINVDLELELDKTLSENTCPTFTDAQFNAPTRSEFFNFNGEKREKRPDLVFSLKDSRPGIDLRKYDAVFAECKIIGGESNKNMGWYVKGGLSKFVDGDYAWAMPQALMIGYIRTTQKMPDPLSEYFFKKKTGGEFNSKVYNLQGDPVMCPQSNRRTVYRVCRTVHSRSWGYPPDGKRKPGPITIRHLWLELNPAPEKRIS